MQTDKSSKAQQLRSLVKSDGTLELSLAMVEIPAPEPNEVVIRVEASPINPSDLGLLFAGADMETAKVFGPTDSPVVNATIPPGAMRALAGRVGSSLPVGNEGAGTVVDAGSSDAAQALVSKTVAVAGGAMYAQYRCVDASQCLVLPDGTLASEGASSFVHPLTALGMEDLIQALIATSATLAFDAIGGGKLAGHILTCMEAAATASATEYSRYGSTKHKQVYIYGGLDRGPTELNRNFGMAWGLGGWLLTPFLQEIGPQAFQGLRQRVAAALKTTFASTYTKEVSLAEALQLCTRSVSGTTP